MRPVMALENNLDFITKQIFRLQDVLCPGSRITYLCTAQCINIVHGSGAVFCKP